MKKYMVAAMIVISSISSAMAQYDNRDYAYNDDRYYYDNEFDWHWDIRVRISDGIQRGLITQYESNKLYRRLEDLERKEYAYQSDGFYNSYEQQEVWNDVIYLNRQVGLELSDYDRNFYGFDVYGYDRRGYSKWYYQGGYDFFRFDKRGFGSIRLGYYPRPNYNGWYRNHDNRIANRYYTERREYAHRGNFSRGDERGDRDRRGGGYNNQYPNNSNRRDNDRNRGGNERNGEGRGNHFEQPNNGGGNSQGNRQDQPNNGGNRNGDNSQGNRINQPNPQPNIGGDRGDYSQGNRIDQPTTQPNTGGDRNTQIPPASRSDRPNFDRIDGSTNNRSDNNGKGGNDWNMNRGGGNRERPSGRRGNE
jgi:hypothetical protein